jgi:hypothetical protein
MTREAYQQPQDTPPLEGGAQMNHDLQPMPRSVQAPWRKSARARVFRVAAIGLLACVSILGASANSSHQARAAQAATNAAAAAFSVTNVTVSVSPSSFNGTCSPTMPFTFTATFTFPAGNPGGQLQYNWVFGPSALPNAPSQTTVYPYPVIAPGQTTYTTPVSAQPVWNVPAANGNGVQGDGYVTVTGPNFVQSSPAYFTLTCSFTVTSVTLSGSGSCLFGLHYGGTIDVAPSPGGTLTYSWQFVNSSNVNTFGTGQVSVSPGQTTVTLFAGNPFPYRVPPGTYGTILVVTTPNMVYSNPIIRTC